MQVLAGRIGMLCAVSVLLVGLAPAAQREQRIPRQPAKTSGAVLGLVHGPDARGVPGAAITIRNAQTGQAVNFQTSADGVFRVPELRPGRYVVEAARDGFQPYRSVEFEVKAGDMLPLAIALVPGEGGAAPVWRGVGPPPSLPESEAGPYRELPRAESAPPEQPPERLPPAGSVFVSKSDRWDIEVPHHRRYSKKGELQQQKKGTWNPFERNKLKGDYPIWGEQTFLVLSAISDTVVEARRLPVASGVSGAAPGNELFFGHGGQFAYPQNFRFTADLFHGDTAYKPANWRIRVTPVANFNYLKAQENGVVNIDVRAGTSRFDGHVGLQELFVEKKLRDLSPNYDFISIRVGIQQFTSDFRGFLFVEEQPGIRIFGNLKSNRIEYNAAYFYFLEKNTNSLLNTFDARRQGVLIGNVYIQDFIWKGYTTQFSFHLNKDDAGRKYDDNDFLVRPAPIGLVSSRAVNVKYLGWTGNGHIHRINISHAFYHAFGRESLNLIAGRPVDINAQMAAVELSYDKDWARFKVSAFYASGDGDPRDGTARGFDTIVDQPAFAGGVFALWNREQIRLTSTGVALVGPDSFLASLRPNKFQGKANFVNPGIMLLNAGSDLEVTPKLRAILNANFMRFVHTEPLELLLFQSPIRHGIGADYSLGLQYRPKLSENVVLTGGASVLTPFQGFRDIYSNHELFTLFTNVRFRF